MRTLAFVATLIPAVAFAGGPTFSASSEKKSDRDDHSAAMAFDGLLSTSWAEDAPTGGEGQWLQVDLGEDVAIGTLTIWPGAFGNMDDWKGRNRAAEVTITGTGPDGEFQAAVSFGDRFSRKDVALNKTVRTLKITVDEIHEGTIFRDLHIAEIAFDFAEKPEPAWKEAIDKDIAKSRKTRDLPEQWPQTLDDAYAAAKSRDSFSKNFKYIGESAVRGPDYLVPFVQQHVPVGHRLKLLQFHEDAIDMLGKLKDPNAIQYLEVAAAGAQRRDDVDWLMGSVDYFRAYADLIRTPRATVPNWGSTGREKGAFDSRGEPLSLATDSLGNVWVADTGNNRVQRLTAEGSPDVILGNPEKGIADAWFGDDEAPYATAALPGDGPTEFTQPLHLVVGNYDVLAVVDATMTVRTFDSEGKPLKQWKVDSPYKPEPGTGVGTPVVTWKGDDFYVIAGSHVYVYNGEGELKTDYALEDGKVQCAVIAAGGKLLVRHSGTDDIIEYRPEDGFRLGSWIKRGLPDDGSEDWDLTTDADDALFIATDAGKVYKYNKRGKLEATYTSFENPRDRPRVAAFSNLIFVSGKDEIARIEQEEQGGSKKKK